MQELIEAARAVIARWDTPLWKDVEPTAHVINALRSALSNAETHLPDLKAAGDLATYLDRAREKAWSDDHGNKLVTLSRERVDQIILALGAVPEEKQDE